MSAGLVTAELAELLRQRRSVNLFTADRIDRELLLEAIELARWAPNHRLTEPWRFYLIGEQMAEAIARLAQQLDTAAKGERFGAARYQRLKAIPGNLVVTSQRSEDAVVERENYAAVCCAMQNLMLYLWQCNVGVKWTTGAITRDAAFYELLGIDADAELVVGFFWYGKPKVVPTQKRRAVAEIVVEIP